MTTAMIVELKEARKILAEYFKVSPNRVLFNRYSFTIMGEDQVDKNWNVTKKVSSTENQVTRIIRRIESVEGKE